MRSVRLIGIVLGCISTVCVAGPINISEALELVSATTTKYTDGNGATAHSGLGSTGTRARGFSGTLSTSASVDIDRFDRATSTASIRWTYVFKVTQSLIGDITVGYTYGFSDGVYSNLSATADSSANLFGLGAQIVAPNGYVYGSHSWSDAGDSSSCDTSWPDDCSSGQFTRDGLGGSYTFQYLPGYAAGSLLTLSGSMRSYAYADTYAGSANANGSTWLSFSASAPEPSTLDLLLFALIPLVITAGSRKAAKQQGALR